ncbi:MAG: hypothetical protein H6732_15505 [Alphaproteobacteria bacterium]|nr:hypothetical protein [Alphaproteobacteria bacterium]
MSLWILALLACGDAPSNAPEAAPVPAGDDEAAALVEPPVSDPDDMPVPSERVVTPQGEPVDDADGYVPDLVTPTLPPGLVVEAVYEPGVLLEDRIADLAAAARLDGVLPVVELWGGWCGSCRRLHESMADPQMLDAFAGTRIIRVDTVAWKEAMVTLQVGNADQFSIPAFYVAKADGALGSSIDGHAWRENVPENMAPPLKRFFRQHGAR